LLPSIYPRLRNRCLAINNSPLLVPAEESCTRCLATTRLEHTYFFRYFGLLVRMSHFSLLILFLILTQSGKREKWNYIIHGKIVTPDTHIHIHSLFYIYRFCKQLFIIRYYMINITNRNSLRVHWCVTSKSGDVTVFATEYQVPISIFISLFYLFFSLNIFTNFTRYENSRLRKRTCFCNNGN
jgi:hypothetical protein